MSSDEVATQPAAARDPGEPVGGDRYVLLERIGEGGMGVVWTAYDRALDRKVALKFLHERYLGAVHQERLAGEARVMARLSHPNVVPVYDVGERDGRTFLTMELVEGRSLDRWLAAAPRSPEEIVELFRAAGRGLAAAHAAGIVHRDVKPSNLLVGTDGRVRMADFGVSLAEAAAPPGDVGLAVTEASVAGSPAYMAPEQLRGQVADARSDQFGLCVSMYEALVGRRPFAGATFEELVAAIERGAPPLPPEVPAWVGAVISRGLAVDPAARFPSVDALVEALVPPRPRRWPRAVAVVVLALAAGAGVTTIASLGGRAGETPAPACEALAEEAFGDAWSDEGRAGLIAAFTATGAAEAEPQARRTADALDGYRAAWLRQSTAACQAVRRHDWPPELGGLAARCLTDHRRELAALVGALARADAGAVERGRNAVARLLPPMVCGDADHLSSLVAPDADPALAEPAALLEDRIAELRAAVSLQRWDEVERVFAEVKPRIEALGDTYLLSHLFEAESDLARHREDLPAAIAAARRAYVAARRHRDVAEAADAAANLVWLYGYEQRQFDEAELWAELALVEIQRIPVSRIAINVHNAISNLADRRGQGARGVEHARKSLEIAAQVLGKDHLLHARYAQDLANALVDAGKPAEAVAVYRDALPGMEQAFGPDSSAFALALSYYADGLSSTGDHEGARAAAVRSIEVGGRATMSNASRGVLFANHGIVLSRAGDSEAAIAAYEQARVHHADQPAFLAQELSYLGQARWQLARERDDAALRERAIADLTEAARLIEVELGADHVAVAEVLSALADAHDCARAVPLAERALAIYQRAGTAGPPEVAARARLDQCRGAR